MALYIGINGIKGSGKDFVGKKLANALTKAGFTYKFSKFADPIKTALESTYGEMTEEQYDEFKRTQHPINVGGEARLIFGREIVRGMGMLMRSYDGGQQFLDHVMAPTVVDVVIVTDLRFDNEFTAIPWHRKIKVFNPKLESDGHESERDCPNEWFEYLVKNDGAIHGDHNTNVVVNDIVRELRVKRHQEGSQ